VAVHELLDAVADRSRRDDFAQAKTGQAAPVRAGICRTMSCEPEGSQNLDAA